MQVNCFHRNWHSKVCIPKCTFYDECYENYISDKVKRLQSCVVLSSKDKEQTREYLKSKDYIG